LQIYEKLSDSFVADYYYLCFCIRDYVILENGDKIIDKMDPRFQQALIQTQKEMREVTKLSDATTDGIRSTSFATCGVTCSTQINLETDGDIIKRVEIVKGCEGNTKGLARLCEGRRIQDVIGLLEGIDCKGRGTSCPDQLARALKQL
jgi:uncharacterized protein (TIGR03905 family)